MEYNNKTSRSLSLLLDRHFPVLKRNCYRDVFIPNTQVVVLLIVLVFYAEGYIIFRLMEREV